MIQSVHLLDKTQDDIHRQPHYVSFGKNAGLNTSTFIDSHIRLHSVHMLDLTQFDIHRQSHYALFGAYVGLNIRRHT